MGNIESSETIILFFFIGIATLGVMGFPSFMSHMQSMTPEAFAEEQKLNVLSNYYYQPIIASSYLVMPVAVVLPPPDPTMLFETMYAQPIQLEFGIIENGIQEFLIPNINKLDFLPPEINKFLNDFEVLPKAFAITTNQNKKWEWREHDKFASFTPVITAIQFGEFARLSSTGGSLGTGYIMKSFNKTEITGSDITIKWEDPTGGTSFRLYVVDGNFSASSLVDFPDEANRITKGAGIISSQIDTLLEGIVIDTLPASSINYSDSTEGVVTVLVFMPDSASTISQQGDVYQIDISTIGNYTFNQNIITTVSGTENDYGYFNTTFTSSIPDQVTGLNITQNMNNNATLDWNDATLADNYQVLRLNNFTSGGNVNGNGTWQFREQQLDAQATFNPSCTFLTFSDRIEMNALGFGSDVSDCYLFKTFPRELMNGSQIQINYDFSNNIGSNIVTLYSNTQNEPNQYDRNNELEWKETGQRFFTTAAPDVIDDESESTVLNGGRLTANVIDVIGDWATVDTDYSSIVFKLIDTSILFQNTKLKVYWINITDFTSGDQRAFYNFSGSTVTLDPEICNDGFDCKRGVFNVGSFNVTSEIFEEIATTITSDFVDSTIPLQGVSTYKVRGNGTNGFGLNSTEVDFGLIQQIDSLIDLGAGLFGGGTLNATAINSTAIKITWDQATTEHPTDPLIGVLIQRNGTTITTVDDLDVSYVDNGLNATTTYSYRLKGVSAVSTGSFGTNNTATTLSLVLPDQVTGLSITQEMNNNATLDWNDATLANNYQVLRKTNFTSGENVNTNATWQFREFSGVNNFQNAFCQVTSFGSGSSGQIRLKSGGFGLAPSTCDLWKTFPRDFINNTNIEINYEFVHDSPKLFLSGTVFVSTRDEPNVPDRADDSDWNSNGTPRSWLPSQSDVGALIDSEALNVESGILTEKMVDVSADWNEPDSDYVSVVVRLVDGTADVPNPEIRIFWINMTDFDTGNQKAFYNFSGSTIINERTGGGCSELVGIPPTNCDYGIVNTGSFSVTNEIFEEVGTPTTSDFEDSTIPLQGVSTYKVRGTGTNGFGLNSTEVDFGLIQQIDALVNTGGLFGSLNTTALNSTAIQLTWDQATTEHPSDALTGVLIQRNGTTITTVDDLDVSYVDNGLNATTTYSYRLKGISAVSTGSFGTNDTATTSSGILPPEKPINLNSTAVQRDVLLKWTQPDGDGIITSNATDFEIKRNGTTIASSIASTFNGVFNDDFGTYTSNASGNLIWESSNCPGTSGNFCGVNATSDSLKTKWASKDNSGISYDIFSNLGINVTDATGNGKFQLLFKLTLENHFGSLANNIMVGLSDEDHLSGRLNTQNFLGARYVDNAGTSIPSNQIVTFMADDENLAVFVDIDSDVGGQGSFDTTGLPRWWNMTYDGTNLYNNVYDCAEQNSGCLISSLTSNDGAEVYENLRYLKMIPLGSGSSGDQSLFDWDDFQLFVNGTSVLTTYIDKNPGLGQTFNYSIIPSNLAGDGIESDQAVVTTNDFPNIPTAESAMSQSGSEIEVSWTSPTDYGAGSPTTGIDPKQIVIFKENTTDATAFSKLVTLPSTQTLFSDTIVDSGKNYTYKIAGQNSIGLGANTTEVIAFTSNNTVIFTVFENDLTTTLQNLAMVTIDNGVDSESKLTDPAGKVQFFEKVGNYNIIVKEIENDFVILKANQTFVGTGTELFNLQTLVFRVNCAVNDPPTDPDVRIIVNQTDAHLVTAHSTPVCTENIVTQKHEITWTETFTSDSASGSIFTSKMIADVLRADTFGSGNEVFEISTVNTGISYDSGLKKLSSVAFDIGTGLSSPSYAFFLELDEVTQGGGGNTGGPAPNPTTNPPIPGGGGAQSTSSPAPFGEFQLPKLSITSDTLFLIAGERFESDIFIDWNVNDNFVITGVRVDKNPRWFAFESTPKPFNAQGAFGTANLGFIIQLDPSYCNPNIGVTVNCVERGEVIIPITIEGIVGGKKVEEQHFLTIDTSERFGIATFLIIFFVIFLIIALAVASNRASKNNKKKVQQKVKKRVSQKNKKKGSTVERLRSRR